MRPFQKLSAVAGTSPALAGLSLIAWLTGCPSNRFGVDAGPTQAPSVTDVADEPTEWVNFHVELPVDAGAFDSLASGLFGAAAQAGHFLTQQAIGQAFEVTSAADPTTPAQVRLTFAFDDGSGTPRVLAVTPASYAVGQIFISTVDAAIAQMQSDVASHAAAGEIFDLEYQATSTQGGTLSLGLKGNAGAYTLALDITSPHTSLLPGAIGQAASADGPFDLVSGTVNFTMTNNEFDYFVSHAYGQGATGGQNFSDFALVPYLWLRLSVTPNLSTNLVNVAFKVLTPDGTSIAIAQAPASVMAGSTFQALVDRQMAQMTAQEQTKVGSSIPWKVPFYYDQPSGGGVVQVIASGALGVFSVAYSVASPQHPLQDVPFLAYKAVSFPPPDPNATTPCNQLGNPQITQALNGVFQITFSASSAITASLAPGQQLVGDIGCSIFNAADVTVSGPNPGVSSLEDFTVPAVNLLASPPSFTTHTALPDGEYQILCAQYVDGNDSKADKGDPVTLPIGSFTLACNVNPVAVQFAILDPQS